MTHNVLVTAASRRVALVTSLQRAVRRLAPGSRVVATDISPWSPAVHVADAARRVPRSDAPGYVEALLAICEADRISLLVPTIDDELEIIAEAEPLFARLGVRVAVPTVDTVRTCRDKAATATFLQSHGVPAVTTWTPTTLDVERPPLPLFIKPRRGRGSVAAYPVHTQAELDFFLTYVPDPVIQPFLRTPEFTIDMLCDFEGRLLSAVPRERQVIRAGVSDRGRTVRDARLLDIAVRCAAAFTFRGAVNLQCRMLDDRPVVFEINPRFSGSIQLTEAAGARFAEWLVRLSMGEYVAPSLGEYTEGLWMSSYETSLFFDAPPTDVLADVPVPAAAAVPAPARDGEPA